MSSFVFTTTTVFMVLVIYSNYFAEAGLFSFLEVQREGRKCVVALKAVDFGGKYTEEIKYSIFDKCYYFSFDMKSYKLNFAYVSPQKKAHLNPAKFPNAVKNTDYSEYKLEAIVEYPKEERRNIDDED